MKEVKFDDLGLDGGEDIFKKFTINIEEICNNKKASKEEDDKEVSTDENNKNDEK